MSRYVRNPEIRLTELEGEGVVLHLGNRRYYTVSSSGLLILNALEHPRSLDHLLDLLMETYEVTREEARETALAFLDECVSNGMVICENGT